MTGEPANYTGRFAPSPTGPLHFGSLLTAVASYAQARSNDGTWLLRIEDIDPPREPPGSDKLILDALVAYGFEWDGEVTYQSKLTPRHECLVEDLLRTGKAYYCSCSRRDLANSPRGSLGTIYPGTCRDGCAAGDNSVRLRTNNKPIEFTDALQGTHCQRLESESGDFVIKRRDGLIAYHMAVVVDDFEQGITEVVRGIDLIDSTPRHIWLQKTLGFPEPDYMHIPIAINSDGQKLSKLTGANGIDIDNPGQEICTALEALGQRPPAGLDTAKLPEIWQWTIDHWRKEPMRGQIEIPAGRFGYG